MNYKDDSSNVLYAPLSVNTLKWSESFMGDAMMYDLWCKYEEPLRRIAFDFDYPKSHYLGLLPMSIPFHHLVTPVFADVELNYRL